MSKFFFAALAAAAMTATSSLASGEATGTEMPPCKDTVVETEDTTICTTDDGVTFSKRGTAWFRMEKLHEKPLGGENSVPNVVGRTIGDAGRRLGIKW